MSLLDAIPTAYLCIFSLVLLRLSCISATPVRQRGAVACSAVERCAMHAYILLSFPLCLVYTIDPPNAVGGEHRGRNPGPYTPLAIRISQGGKRVGSFINIYPSGRSCSEALFPFRSLLIQELFLFSSFASRLASRVYIHIPFFSPRAVATQRHSQS